MTADRCGGKRRDDHSGERSQRSCGPNLWDKLPQSTHIAWEVLGPTSKSEMCQAHTRQSPHCRISPMDDSLNDSKRQRQRRLKGPENSSDRGLRQVNLKVTES